MGLTPTGTENLFRDCPIDEPNGEWNRIAATNTMQTTSRTTADFTSERFRANESLGAESFLADPLSTALIA